MINISTEQPKSWSQRGHHSALPFACREPWQVARPGNTQALANCAPSEFNVSTLVEGIFEVLAASSLLLNNGPEVLSTAAVGINHTYNNVHSGIPPTVGYTFRVFLA